MTQTRTLTMKIISPDIGHIRSVIDSTLQVAITHPDATIEVHVTKAGEI